MAQTPSPGSESNPTSTEKQADPRKSRTVRFTDSEWDEVRTAAEAHGLPAAEFVRERMLAVARDPSADATPADLAPLIERTFRYTYMIATKMRDDMDREGRAGEVEKLIDDARKLQDSLRDGAGE